MLNKQFVVQSLLGYYYFFFIPEFLSIDAQLNSRYFLTVFPLTNLFNLSSRKTLH